jgi:uracil-DNA glycosylase
MTTTGAARALAAVAEEAGRCQACPLWERATQTVFGAGPVPAQVMLLGEQPGDQEDRQGAPFVGPAGKVLDRALADAAIDRDKAYVTNAVKHFKWQPRGKRRIHERPNREEMAACRRWLEREMELVDPELLVLLGATAGQALLGPSFRVGTSRGQILETELAPMVLATVHPSSVLRTDDAEREAAYEGLVHDLRVGAEALSAHRGTR